jgi:structural maintenance of chromosome 2
VRASRLEKEETALKQKLAIVTGDKDKIRETIATLDEKKREALLKTWRKVSRYDSISLTG